MDKNSKEFDIVVFGATGYTGEYVVEELGKVLKDSDKKWAVAGRNKRKLTASLQKVQQYMEDGVDLLSVPVIEADVSNEQSIDAMCRRTKLIYNCVGPYKLYGEIVVAACVRHGTHHVDLSGELVYLETMQEKYFQAARDNRAYIVQACGFDSIPSDFGLAMLKEKFSGDLNSVEIFAHVSGGPEGRVTNIGTWMSAVHSVRDVAMQWRYTRGVKKIFTKELPVSRFGNPFRFPLFYDEEVGSWCTFFPGPDERVMERSQMFGYQFLNERPVHAKVYMQLPSFMTAFCSLFLSVAVIMSFFSCGRTLLEKYPSFFTLGMFSKEGPTRKQVESGSTKLTIRGKGWSVKLPEPTDQHTEAPNKEVKLVISGPEPAYALTSICMVHSGLTILEETEKLPLSGGVLTPGVAFPKTTLLKRLEKRGISFQFFE